MERIDDRTQADFEAGTHTYLVVATDRFMTRWGRECGRIGRGTSVCAWACTLGQLSTVRAWVKARGDMLRVRTVWDGKGRFRPKGADHFHVYRVHENHPALTGE